MRRPRATDCAAPGGFMLPCRNELNREGMPERIRHRQHLSLRLTPPTACLALQLSGVRSAPRKRPLAGAVATARPLLPYGTLYLGTLSVTCVF